MHSIGINIGSSNVKVTMLEGFSPLWSEVMPHEGNFPSALKKILAARRLPEGLKSLATGTEGRHLLNLNSVIEPICVEEALKHIRHSVNAVVSLGGEDLVVYTVDENRKILTNFSGNKCASGTGEFFKQQLARMDMKLADIGDLPGESRVLKLSSRCSVFMKSDCTHRLNKGEATKGDIVLSLSDVMATKVIDFLKRARIAGGSVLLTGGVTLNGYLLRFIRERLPEIEFIVPEQAPYFEAFGAALLAKAQGSVLPSLEKLLKPAKVQFKRFKSLGTAGGRVTYLEAKRGRVQAGREYILGVDGGSTTTKACLIDIETDEMVASYYGRTHGDPVRALKGCLVELRAQVREEIGEGTIRVTLASTTGSSREILGVFLETPAVYNEIIAHAVGTTFFRPEIDTIFEIGGQDAKYIHLQNMVPIDYAMNEACSAGTGSFLEESAQGDLNIPSADLIGGIAVKAAEPLKFGEHCSAFINSDIRSAINQGASREDITAGIVTSIVSNYLNRVVGNRTIGNAIVLQGGVAKNIAVPLAFAMLLDRDILVPPDPELMGCFGVGILARRKHREGLVEKREYSLDRIIDTEIVYEREFKCRACDNFCPVRVLNVNGNKYMFGGRCNKYANKLRNRLVDEATVPNYVELRNRLLFEECAPDPARFRKRSDARVGVPRAFSIYTLWPFYSWFFHELGVETELSHNVSREGTARVESAYCFPAEIAHGAVQDSFDRGVDYIFVPHFRDMEGPEAGVPGNFCPITQSLPYYIRKAFPEIPEGKYLAPVVSFQYGREKAAEPFLELGRRLGFTAREARLAFEVALEKQNEYFTKARELGERALGEARAAGTPVIALLGRPYNAFTPDANMGVPRKFTSRGYSIIPFDILPFGDEKIYPNMYWYYGQLDMKACALLAGESNIFVAYISNFSCAPDSFMLHYLKWMMGTKPFLVLELDSHTADAGVDTRIEAFLDIIDGYRTGYSGSGEERYDNGLRFVSDGRDGMYIRNTLTGGRIEISHNPRVKVLLSNMGRLSTEMLAASMRSLGVNAEAMPVPDVHTLQLARNHASGKECLPSHLVLGSVLRYLASGKYRKDEIYLLFVPTTTGPCRTGQYFVFFDNLFRDLRLENVVVFTLDSDNSYNELGRAFSKYAWWAVVAGDYMKDIETSLRTCASDPAAAMERYDALWRRLISVAEKDITGAVPALEEIATEISRIPLRKTIDRCPKVLIVGEIYVRRDDFAVDELIQHFSRRGIIGKVSGVAEWVYYCDFVREYEIRKKLRLRPWYSRPFSREFGELVRFRMELAYKHHTDRTIKKALSAANLIPVTPHDMRLIMENSSRNFTDHELHSEIAISSGVAATAMGDGYSGIVNISPFACLIGRVIEGLYTPWARERRYPVMSIEIDGNLFPPGVVSKLEIFMLNVLRFKSDPDIAAMMENEGVRPVVINRKIVRE